MIDNTLVLPAPLLVLFINIIPFIKNSKFNPQPISILLHKFSNAGGSKYARRND